MAHYLEFSDEEYEDQCEVASFLLDYWEKEYDEKIKQQFSIRKFFPFLVNV